MDRLRSGAIKFAVTAAAGGLCALVLPGLAQASSSGGNAPGAASSAAFWAPMQVGSSRMTKSQAIAAAREFRIFVAPAPMIAPYVSDMKAANPSVILLGYLNGTYQPSATAFPASWYLRDGSGRPVRSRGYGQYLMDFLNPGWISNRVATCLGAIKSAHLDGCHVDVLGTGSLYPGYVTGLPINPQTHRVFTDSEYLHGTDALAATIQRNAPGKVIIGNGLGDGTRFYTVGPSSILLNGEAGGVAEDWLHDAVASLSSYPSVSVWKMNVDMLAKGSQGKIIVTITKTWGRGTAAQIAAWHQFALATFMLGDSGRDSFSFFASRTSSAVAPDPWYGFPVGSPVGSYFAQGNGFERDFTTGKVLVNPGTASMTVKLGGTYRDISGRHMTSLTLPAHTAIILTSQ